MTELSLAAVDLMYDFVKHITTLDTALIIILATLVEKVFEGKISLKWLFFACIIFLCISIIGSLLFMGIISTWTLTKSSDPSTAWPGTQITMSFYLSITTFAIGLGVFLIFTIVNSRLIKSRVSKE